MLLLLQADRQARWHAQQQELEEVRKANEVTLGNFVANLDRPMSADEQHVFLRAHAGLDVPEGNPLNLLPMRAPAPPGPSTRSTSLSQARCGALLTSWHDICACAELRMKHATPVQYCLSAMSHREKNDESYGLRLSLRFGSMRCQGETS